MIRFNVAYNETPVVVKDKNTENTIIIIKKDRVVKMSGAEPEEQSIGRFTMVKN